jgi:hypothetical protein
VKENFRESRIEDVHETELTGWRIKRIIIYGKDEIDGFYKVGSIAIICWRREKRKDLAIRIPSRKRASIGFVALKKKEGKSK